MKTGDTVEVVILGVNVGEQRLSLGLKQALGDPWADVPQKFPVGSAIEGPITSITKFGAFVQVAEGVEGMVHVSEISAEKRINHPQDVVKVGQVVQAQVIGIDSERRNMRLSMKQLVPTSIDEYIAEHKRGDVITGRVMEESGGSARVQLGEGIQATCRLAVSAPAKEESTECRESRFVLAEFDAAGALEGRRSRHGRAEARSNSRRTDSQLPHREARPRDQDHRAGTGLSVSRVELAFRPASKWVYFPF